MIFYVLYPGIQIGKAFSGATQLRFHTLQAVFGISDAFFGFSDPLTISGNILLKVSKTLLHSINRAIQLYYVSFHVVKFCPKAIKSTYLSVSNLAE